MLVKAIYTWHIISYFPSVYTKMNLLTFDLVQSQRIVKSGGTTPEVDGYGPLNNNSHGAFSLTFSAPWAKVPGFNHQPKLVHMIKWGKAFK